jgi:ankyrin repeat protein
MKKLLVLCLAVSCGSLYGAGETALAKAVKSGNIKDVDVFENDEKGYTALMYAAGYGKDDLVREIINKEEVIGADPDSAAKALLLAIKNKARVTGMTAKGKYDKIVKLLVDALIKNRSHDSLDKKDENGQTGLMIAVKNDDQNSAKILLKARANPHEKDKNGNSALIQALKDKNGSMVRLFKDEGVSLEPIRDYIKDNIMQYADILPLLK